MLPKVPSPPLLSLSLSASRRPHMQFEKIRQPSHCNIDVLCAAAICLPNLQRKPRSTGSSMKRWWPRPRREVSSFHKAIDVLFHFYCLKSLLPQKVWALQLCNSGKAGIFVVGLKQVPVCKTALCCLQNWRMLRKGRSSWRIAASWRRALAMPPRPGTRRSCPTGLQCEYKHQLIVKL